MTDRPRRVMWLLNHTTARNFEIPMLKRIGVQEIFLPKVIPNDPAFRSATIDWSEDSGLTVPENELAILNQIDWYQNASADAWQLANAYFDAVFFILIQDSSFKSMLRHFHGAKIWRAYGLSRDMSYGKTLHLLDRHGDAQSLLEKVRNFWFGEAYDHLANIEPSILQKNAVFLPAGLANTTVQDRWTGEDKRIFFVCPNIAISSYYQEIYQNFRRDFHGLPYVIGGAQSISVPDLHVLGYLPSEQHHRNMRNLRVMYYHSTEPNHVHYHPFEAIRAGMPLVFMAGSLLDRLGGSDLPGRCQTPKDARQKIQRILANDRDLIDRIRSSQPRLLEPMKMENCEAAWRSGLDRIFAQLRATSSISATTKKPKKRIAVIVPVEYRGGSLRGAKLLAQAIAIGSKASDDDIQVVFGHIDNPSCYGPEDFEDLPAAIKRRPYRWKKLSHNEAVHACTYVGGNAKLADSVYYVPDDGIRQFADCDLWIVVSDRLLFPLLPIRPHLLVIYDYLQRYEHFLDGSLNAKFVSRAHAAEAVLVTTDFTAQDARQFAGVPARSIKKLPMLTPDFSAIDVTLRSPSKQKPFFIWTTNLAPHKNHENAFKALRLYYEKHHGSLECLVTGVETGQMLTRHMPHLEMLRDIYRSSQTLKKKLKFKGELPDQEYRLLLRQAAFLWHPGRIDNGTFSVVEAAHFHTPALSSDYPAMREMDRQFSLSLTWMDSSDPQNMARQLKAMETDPDTPRSRLPSAEHLASQSINNLAGAYWKAIKEYL